MAELDPDATIEDVLQVLPDGSTDEEVFAAIQRRRWGPLHGALRAPPGAPRQRQAPPRDRRHVRCANCGGKGHMANECSKESLPKHKRPCFVCGRPGHLARDCKDRPAQAMEGDGSLDRYNLCPVCDEGWSTPPPKRTAKPQRRPITLADYVTPKFFKVMTCDDEDESNWDPEEACLQQPLSHKVAGRRSCEDGMTGGGTPDTRPPTSTAAHTTGKPPRPRVAENATVVSKCDKKRVPFCHPRGQSSPWAWEGRTRSVKVHGG